jgi:hypothetical protein
MVSFGDLSCDGWLIPCDHSQFAFFCENHAPFCGGVCAVEKYVSFDEYFNDHSISSAWAKGGFNFTTGHHTQLLVKGGQR